MFFSGLSEYIQKLDNTASRNEITRILALLFRELKPAEIDKVCYLFSGRIAPAYEGIEFQLAEKMMIRAIALAFKSSVEKVTVEYKKRGDLGDVAEELSDKKKVTSNKLSVEHVFSVLKEIALESGKDSQERKLSKVAGLLTLLDPLSAKYIARIPTGNLRLGFSDMTILDALSVMLVGDKSARKQIEAAFSVTADIGRIANQVRDKGLPGIKHVKAEPGVPIRAALAERLASAEKVVEKMDGKFAVEPKMDGFRTQIHVWKVGKIREVRLFSRNLENVTHMFPEIVEAGKALNVESAIFDAESIGFNPKTGKFAPFQETVSRKRKHGIEQMALDLPLKAFVFDLLYLNGETFIDKPFSERRENLESLFAKASKGQETIILTDQETVETSARLRAIVEGYLKDGLEGAMAKRLGVAYQAGGRGYHWVKFKRHTENIKGEDSKVADTIDCVLMGAYVGKGKRVKFGVGGFLIGVPGKDDKYYTLTNLGTGLTDEQFREMFKMVEKLKVSVQPSSYVVDKLTKPDIWVKPQAVLEVLADEITPSPRHTAKFSLRFPRLIRVRDDKNPEQATSVHEVQELYKMQTNKN